MVYRHRYNQLPVHRMIRLPILAYFAAINAGCQQGGNSVLHYPWANIGYGINGKMILF